LILVVGSKVRVGGVVLSSVPSMDSLISF
jgi:hypothetical protein